VLQKKAFKVLAAIPKKDGTQWWMKCGSAHTNKDDSINVYLDAMPRDLKFQLRELDEEDLRRREAYRTGAASAAGAAASDPGAPLTDSYRASQLGGGATPSSGVPF